MKVRIPWSSVGGLSDVCRKIADALVRTLSVPLKYASLKQYAVYAGGSQVRLQGQHVCCVYYVVERCVPGVVRGACVNTTSAPVRSSILVWMPSSGVGVPKTESPRCSFGPWDSLHTGSLGQLTHRGTLAAWLHPKKRQQQLQEQPASEGPLQSPQAAVLGNKGGTQMSLADMVRRTPYYTQRTSCLMKRLFLRAGELGWACSNAPHVAHDTPGT
eukprot:1161915-Pelagomonas_calceolata.AAC.5